MDYLRQLDLNLLVTLDALLAERSVTRVARRLGLSQPSVSVQLAKLRAFFEDPLLLAGGREMRLTARAEGLREPLHAALAGVAGAIGPASFSPATASGAWRIACSDYGELAVIVPALATLRAAAPGTRLAVVEQRPVDTFRRAESGEIDLALHTTDDAPPGLRRRPLFAERYVLVGRRDHPRLRRRPTLALFRGLEHVVVSPSGGGFVGPTDLVLAGLGLERRVVLSAPRFLSALAAVARTDLVAMVPSRITLGREDLRVVEAPVDVPGYTMAMVWHERLHRDPAQRWLRDRLAEAVAG